MNELPWLAFARLQLGIKEVPGPGQNPAIQAMFRDAFTAVGQAEKLKLPVWRDESTPWCGVFVAYVLAHCDLAHRIPLGFPLARAWQRAGAKLEEPAYGCVVVFSRGAGGHVGFVVGRDQNNHLLVLGGNQGDSVSIRPFNRNRVLAYRWCGKGSAPAPERFLLPTLASDGRPSQNEA